MCKTSVIQWIQLCTHTVMYHHTHTGKGSTDLQPCSYSTFASVHKGIVVAILLYDCPGEVIWMRHILDKYHAAAKQQGVRIVHCCGFDSIPSDLGTCLVVDHLNRLGKYVQMQLSAAEVFCTYSSTPSLTLTLLAGFFY